MYTTYRWAITHALTEEMDNDPATVLMGEDVADAGGAFGMSRGLLERFGAARVRDTPICEEVMMGLGTGGAAFGLRPIVEIQFMDFLLLASDMLLNHAAKLHYMTNGQYHAPLTVRCLSGGGFRSGAQHSQSLEGMLIQTPGLKVVAPSSPADAKGLLKAAIRDENPVVVMEQKRLLGVKGEVPDETDYLIALGKANVAREGTDVTVVGLGAMVGVCLEAAEKLATDGISAEVIDPRTIAPLDEEAILQSVAKTSRLVVAHEAPGTGGFGAEVAALVADKAIYHLDAPVRRVTGAHCAIPVGVAEDLVLPDVDAVVRACRDVVVGEDRR